MQTLSSHLPSRRSRSWQSILTSIQAALRAVAPAFWAQTEELSIQQVQSRHGEILWHVYDRSTGREAYLSSEDEVFAWIEQRYHAPYGGQ